MVAALSLHVDEVVAPAGHVEQGCFQRLRLADDLDDGAVEVRVREVADEPHAFPPADFTDDCLDNIAAPALAEVWD